MQRGREKKSVDRVGLWYQGIAMGLVLLFSYGILSVVSYGFDVLRHGVDILDPKSRDLERIATYIWPFDQDLARFSDDANILLKQYVAKQNIFQTDRDRLDRVWSYVATHHEELTRYGFEQYDNLFGLFARLYPHREEVYQLLGSKQPITYVIALQNTGEKRPNGGFFGSFVVLTIDKGQIVTFKPVDSYFPDSIAPRARLSLEKGLTKALGERRFGFVDANQYGFTDMDGANIKRLYERVFHDEYDLSMVQAGPYVHVWDQLYKKNIKGVIFLRTDMFEDLIPGFEKKIRERQFVNASIDLIRGESRTNKKELYMREMTHYFDENYVAMMLSVLGNVKKIQQKHYINMFFSDVSDGLQQWLINESFTNIYDRDTVYLWDSNYSYNKVDRFVTKEVIVRRDGQVVNEYVDNDILSVRDWEPGEYVLDVYYQLNIPQQYRDFIVNLSKKYNITLTQRELGILCLSPANRDMLWSFRSMIHFPGSWKINKVSGDGFDIIDDYSDLGRFLAYRVESPFNNSTSHVSVSITIPQKN